MEPDGYPYGQDLRGMTPDGVTACNLKPKLLAAAGDYIRPST